MAICPSGHSSSTDDYCDVCGARIGGGPAPGSASAMSGARNTMPTTALPASGNGEPCPDCGTPRADRFCEECGYDFSTGTQHQQRIPQPAVAPLPPPGQQQPFPPSTAQPLPQQGSQPIAQPVPPGRPAAPTDPSLYDRREQPQQTGPPTARWVAVVAADREYYEAVLAQDGPDASAIAFPPYCPERRVPMTGSQIRIGRRSSSRGIFPEIDLSEPPEDPGVSRTHAVLLPKPDGSWTLVDPGSSNGTTVNDTLDPIAVNVEIPLQDGDRIHVGAWTTITIRRG